MADITQFTTNATIHLHRHDLPPDLTFGAMVAVDTETMGLNPHRDRLCLVQLSAGDGVAHLVQIVPERLGGHGADCPNLKRLLLPEDDLSFACWLTSPLGDLTDESLMDLAAGRSQRHLVEALRVRARERPEWARAWAFFWPSGVSAGMRPSGGSTMRDVRRSGTTVPRSRKSSL